jgi:hypothetical protein
MKAPRRVRLKPLDPYWVGCVKEEADARYSADPKSAYGTAHVVLALCREVQRMARRIEELEKLQVTRGPK